MARYNTTMPRKAARITLPAVRGQGRLRAAGRGEVLPRLLGQEDRGRGDRRPRVRAQALHPRPQRREIPRLPLDHQASLRPARGRRRRLRPVPDDACSTPTSRGTSPPTTSRRPGRAQLRRAPRRRHRPPKSSSPGAAASGTSRSSERVRRSRKSGTGKCDSRVGPARDERQAQRACRATPEPARTSQTRRERHPGQRRQPGQPAEQHVGVTNAISMPRPQLPMAIAISAAEAERRLQRVLPDEAAPRDRARG